MSVLLDFVASPLGLEPLTAFTLTPVDGAPGLFSLEAVDRPELRMFVLDAAVHLPSYSPELPDEKAAELGIESADGVLTLVVVNPASEGITVNLLAPIVVNAATGASLQVVLDSDFPVRAELSSLAGA